MKIAREVPELHQLRRSLGGARPVALVATMGGLHEGHRSLLRAARTLGADVIASIFVNPLQFGQSADYDRYPRTEAADLAMLSEEGCAGAWLPSVDAMYPPGAATAVHVGGPAQDWEGVFRPGHFRGVATVVAKLFLQTRPDVALFGEKDWQQIQVVRRMSTDLDMSVRVEIVPTVRDHDGLALSSRNRFLTPEQRRLAPMLANVLADCAATGAQDEVLAEARGALERAGFGVDYLARVDPDTLRVVAPSAPARLIAAVRLGSVRLLDTIAVPADSTTMRPLSPRQASMM